MSVRATSMNGALKVNSLLAKLKSSVSELPFQRINITPHLPDNLHLKAKAPNSQLREAGILVPLVFSNDNKLGLLYTLRSDLVGTHKNQVSFPGGMLEAKDQDDLVACALRETKEEIGEDVVTGEGAKYTVLAKCQSIYSITGVIVTPVLALIHQPIVYNTQKSHTGVGVYGDITQTYFPDYSQDEVAAVFIKELDDLKAMKAYEWLSRPPRKGEQYSEKTPVQKVKFPVYRDERDADMEKTRIWGMSALITESVIAHFDSLEE